MADQEGEPPRYGLRTRAKRAMNAELQTEATESGEPTEQPSERDEKDKPMQRAMLAVRAFYSPGARL